MFKKFKYVFVPALSFAAGVCGVSAADLDVSRDLAVQLSLEFRHSEAAVEYRRLALSAGEDAERGAYWWMAAYESWKESRHDMISSLLDRAEDETTEFFAEAMLLRGEHAVSTGEYEEAEFYFSGIADSGVSGDMALFLSRRRAYAAFMDDRPDVARNMLGSLPEENSEGIIALRAYGKGRDKRPFLGGMLGIVPGLGYAYAGEYANALRCLLLNGLFIFGMVETASEDQWGAFAVITFFEVTWYTGSIYGGIDASHRYNTARKEECLQAIKGDAAFQPDFGKLPLLFLDFRF